MSTNMILRTADIRVGASVEIEIFGETYSGECIATDSNRIDMAFIRWEDDSIGRITDDFLLEASRLSIGFTALR